MLWGLRGGLLARLRGYLGLFRCLLRLIGESLLSSKPLVLPWRLSRGIVSYRVHCAGELYYANSFPVPIAMILRKAGAAMAAGCTMVVKPSPETPFSVLALAYLAEQAGFPKGVFSVLPTSLENTPALSEALCRHPLVKKVTFTGSTRVGKLVAKHCSDGLKKVTLELGGNCPFLVFDDANLDQAATRKL